MHINLKDYDENYIAEAVINYKRVVEENKKLQAIIVCEDKNMEILNLKDNNQLLEDGNKQILSEIRLLIKERGLYQNVLKECNKAIVDNLLSSQYKNEVTMHNALQSIMLYKV